MSARGALIKSFFGAFAALTAYWHGLAHGAVLAAPFLVFGLIGLVALKVIRLPAEGLRLSDRVGRVVLWSTIGEGIGLFLAANIVVNLHRPDLLLPSMALVVGLHFVPIAVAARFRPYLIVGLALITAAVAGFSSRRRWEASLRASPPPRASGRRPSSRCGETGAPGLAVRHPPRSSRPHQALEGGQVGVRGSACLKALEY